MPENENEGPKLELHVGTPESSPSDPFAAERIPPQLLFIFYKGGQVFNCIVRGMTPKQIRDTLRKPDADGHVSMNVDFKNENGTFDAKEADISHFHVLPYHPEPERVQPVPPGARLVQPS